MIRFLDTLRQAANAAGWVALLLILVHLVAPRVCAADPQFVGVLAELAKDDVAKQLGLSDETRSKLSELIDRREEQVEQLVLKIMDLPAAEREEKLAPFRQESEKLGLALLDEKQRAELTKILGPGKAAPAVKQPADSETKKRPADAKKQPEPADALRTVFPDAKAKGDVKLRFSFSFAPWKTVLVWFADQADLSLVANDFPVGTFNYKDNSRSYTPTEALDLINSQLLTKNFTLVQRGKQLTLINLDNGPVPKILVPEVSLKELDDKGDFELIRVLFPLKKFTPEEAKTEIEPLLGRHGEVVVLAKSRQIQVTEVAGRLRTIRDVIMRVESPPPSAADGVQILPLKFVTPEEVMAVVRPLMGFDEDSYVLDGDDGKLRIAIDALGTRLFVTGSEEHIVRLKEILKVVDVEIPQGPGGVPLEQPQLEVYAIKGGDPTIVLQVIQTLLAGLPDVRLAVDEEAGKLVALARRSQHDTIAATLKQMEQEGQQLAVIQLRSLDPQSAVLMINKLFGGDVDPKNGGASNAPKVDADPISGRLVVVGTKAQVDQIRDLLEKLDPSLDSGGIGSRGSPRLIPLTPYESRTALGTAERLWSGTNKIRIVTPSSRGGAVEQRSPRGEEPADSRSGFPPIPSPKFEKKQPVEKKPESKKPAETKPAPAKPQAAGAEKMTGAGRSRRNPFVFVHQVATQVEPKKQPQAKAKPAEVQRKTKPGAPIVVEVTPAGIWIASDDLDALDEFERLLLQVTGTPSVGPQYTVFYLKYASATSVAELLTQIFGGGAAAGGGGGSLLGDLAGGLLGGGGGGGGDLLGGLLGLGGGGGASSSSVQIVAEARLNALIVQGSALDIDSIEQLLEVLDQKTGPEEVEVVSKPRMIPILNTSAEEIKAAIEQVYHDRILAAGGGGRQQQPSLEQLGRLLGRGRGGNRGGSQSRRDDPAQKMKLGIHARTNSLIVIAPEPLYQEVLLLVEQLDTATSESNQVVTTYTLRRSNPETVHKALQAILGDSIQSSGTKASSSSGRSGRPSTRSPQQGRPSTGFQPPSGGQLQELLRRRLEAGGQGNRGGGQGNRGGDRGRGGTRGGGDRGRGGRR